MADPVDDEEPSRLSNSRPARRRFSAIPVTEKPGLGTRAVEALGNALTQGTGGQAIANVAAGKGLAGALGGVTGTQGALAGIGEGLGGPPLAVAGSVVGSLISPAPVRATPEDVVRNFGGVPNLGNTLAAALLTDPFGTAGGFGLEKDFPIATKLGIRYLTKEAKPFMAQAITRLAEGGLHTEQARGAVAELLGDVVAKPVSEVVADPVMVARLGTALGTTDLGEITKAIEFTKENLVAKPGIRIAGMELPGVSTFEERRKAFLDAMKTRAVKAVEPILPIAVDKKFTTPRAIRLKQAIEAVADPAAKGDASGRAIWERAVSRGASALADPQDGPILEAAGKKLGWNLESFLSEPTNLFVQTPAAKAANKSAQAFGHMIDVLGRKFGIRGYDPQLESQWRDHIRRKMTRAADFVETEVRAPYADLTPAEREAAARLPDTAGAAIDGVRREVDRQVEEIRARYQGTRDILGGHQPLIDARTGELGLPPDVDKAIHQLREAANAKVEEIANQAIRELPGDLPAKVFRTQGVLRRLIEVARADGSFDELASRYIPHLYKNPEQAAKSGIAAKFGVQTGQGGRDIERIKNELTGNPLFTTIGVAKQVGLAPETDIVPILTNFFTNYVAAQEGRRFLTEVAYTFGVPEKDFLRHVPIAADDIRGIVSQARAARQAQEAGLATETALRVAAKGVPLEASDELARYAEMGRAYEIPEGRGYAPQVSTYRKVEGLPEIDVPKRAGGSAPTAPTPEPGLATAAASPAEAAPGVSPAQAGALPPTSGISHTIQATMPVADGFEKTTVRLRSDIATALDDLAPGFISGDAANAIARATDLVTDLFKSAVTILPPSTAAFTVRQLIGNIYNAILAIGLSALNPFRAVAAYRMLFTDVEDVWKTAFGPYSFSELRKMFHEQVLGSGLGGRQSLSAAALHEEGTLARLRSVGLGKTLSEKGVAGTIRGVSQDVASFPDKLARAQLFMHYLADGLDPTTAALMTRQFVHDISQLTPFEQTWMRRFVPFYGWPRRNIPLQIRSIMEKPYIASVTLKSFDAVGPSDKDKLAMPPYLLDQLTVSMGMDAQGRPLIVGGLSLPVEDVLRILPTDGWNRTIEREILGRVNPILQLPLEAISHRVFFTGREIGLRSSVPAYFANVPGLAQYLDVQPEKKVHGEQRFSADADKTFWLQGFVFSRTYNVLTRAANPNLPWQWKAIDLFTGIRPDVVDRAKAENYRLVDQMRRMDEAGLVKHGVHYYGAKTPSAKRALDAFNAQARTRR